MTTKTIKTNAITNTIWTQSKLLRYCTLFLLFISISMTIAPLAKARNFNYHLLIWHHWLGLISWFVMYSILWNSFRKEEIKSDSLLLPIISLMSGWGLLTVWRIAPNLGLKQTIWLILSISIIIFFVPYRNKILTILKKYKYIWLTFGLLISALTFIFGTNPANFGPKLWLGCCGIYLQPSEPLKLLLILFLSAYFSDRQPFIKKIFPLITPTLLMTGIALLILIFQQDLGTASIFIFIYASMVYVATEKKQLLLVSILIIGIGAIIGFNIFDVVKLRFEAWINPWLDPSGRSFQIVQSLISIAAGGLTGRGPGMGYPNLVPIAFSDFVFTAIAEEYGFPGTLGLILIFIIFTFRSFSVAIKAKDRYQRYLASGLTIYIASQTILIIGGNIRFLPLTGVTLPFFSYGGSSLLTSFLAFFLLIIINQDSTDVEITPKGSNPIIHLATILLVGFISLIIINSWWSIYRGTDLLNRNDNLRRSISDQYNKRGSVFDRNMLMLSNTDGTPGEYQRIYSYPEFSSVIGYTHPFYGQAGIESSLDPILRGAEDQSLWKIWYHHLLFGQSPPGLNIQLSLDKELQLIAANYFHHTTGTVVLMNAQNGEIFVLFSSPIFDANDLENNWDSLQSDPNSPLINRATQSLYPPGPSLAPFLIAQTNSSGELPQVIQNLETNIAGDQFTCTSNLKIPNDWRSVGSYGCPGPLEYLGNRLGADVLEDLFDKLGFYQSPNLRLELSPPVPRSGITNISITAFGQRDIQITPLQMALAAASLSNNGDRPNPTLVLAVQNFQGDWAKNSKHSEFAHVFNTESANQTAVLLENRSLKIWESTAYALTYSGTNLTWYIGGTLPGSEDPYVVVVLLEKRDANLASIIGQRLLTEIKKP